jgi:hypothetical protein
MFLFSCNAVTCWQFVLIFFICHQDLLVFMYLRSLLCLLFAKKIFVYVQSLLIFTTHYENGKPLIIKADFSLISFVYNEVGFLLQILIAY